MCFTLKVKVYVELIYYVELFAAECNLESVILIRYFQQYKII